MYVKHEYMVVTGCNLQNFEDDVATYLSAIPSWRCQGGVAIYKRPGSPYDPWYAQALVREMEVDGS